MAQRDNAGWGEIYKRSWAQRTKCDAALFGIEGSGRVIVRVRILALIDYIFTLQEGRR